jgi:ATP-binding cassette subfamily B protein
MAVVPQKVHLFNGSILENIALGQVQPDMKKVLKICKGLGLMAFIESLSEGFHTPVGENGTALSGGQKQRIAIARALYLEPRILVLDEAASSLDSLSEKMVLDTIMDLRNQGVTIVLISHGLRAMLHADNILVLGKEGLLEEGTHEYLLSKKAHYYNFWKHQTPFDLNVPGYGENSQLQ